MNKVCSSIRYQVRDNIWYNVCDKVNDNICSRFKNNVKDIVCINVCSKVLNIKNYVQEKSRSFHREL